MQPSGGSRHTKTFMGMLGGSPIIKMVGLDSIFKGEENNYMIDEQLKEFDLTFKEAAYEDPEEQSTMGIMDLGR